MDKKSNILVGGVVGVLVLTGAGYWAFSASAGSKAEPSKEQGAAVSGLIKQVKEANEAGVTAEQGVTTSTSAGGSFVASKSGTKYFPIDCGSAKTIKEENKIFFGSASEAESAGYEPAKNCGN